MKVAAFTVAVLDHIPQIGKYFPGGNAFNQAVRFRQMGADVALVGAVGTDEAGDILLKILEQADVDRSFVHQIEGATATNKLRIDEAGERYGIEGAWKGGVYQDYRLSEKDWLFISSCDILATHSNCPDFLNTLSRKKSHQFLAVDFIDAIGYDLLEENIDKIDVAYFGGTPEMEEPLAALARKHQALIVLTLGAMGSVALQGNNVFRQPSIPIDKVVDTTGCGDAFQAAFTMEIVKSKNIAAALLSGAENGRKAARHFGAIEL
jgi:fructoselysine 6-kinase